MKHRIYSDEMIGKAQALRRGGFSFSEISNATGLPRASVMYYVAGIKISEDGHSEILRCLSDVATAFKPGSLQQGQPPMPNIILEALEKISEVMQEKK